VAEQDRRAPAKRETAVRVRPVSYRKENRDDDARDRRCARCGPRCSRRGYLGYLRGQKERLLGTRGQKRVHRPELDEAHGFDTKYAMHAARLGYQGLELLETGFLTLPMPEPDRSRVMAIRTGERTFRGDNRRDRNGRATTGGGAGADAAASRSRPDHGRPLPRRGLPALLGLVAGDAPSPSRPGGGAGLDRVVAPSALDSRSRMAMLHTHAPIDQGAEMRAAFMSIEEAVVTYLEGMTLASQNAQLGDPGACRRR
jgi:hypothetical protein